MAAEVPQISYDHVVSVINFTVSIPMDGILAKLRRGEPKIAAVGAAFLSTGHIVVHLEDMKGKDSAIILDAAGVPVRGQPSIPRTAKKFLKQQLGLN